MRARYPNPLVVYQDAIDLTQRMRYQWWRVERFITD
jgi:hypothetical protein